MDLNTFKSKSNIEIMDYLSIKIRAERNKRRKSQNELAELAGIPLRTYKRFEQNCNGSLDNFINVLRAFDKVNFFQTIFIEESQHRILEPKDIIAKAKIKSLSRD